MPREITFNQIWNYGKGTDFARVKNGEIVQLCTDSEWNICGQRQITCIVMQKSETHNISDRIKIWEGEQNVRFFYGTGNADCLLPFAEAQKEAK